MYRVHVHIVKKDNIRDFKKGRKMRSLGNDKNLTVVQGNFKAQHHLKKRLFESDMYLDIVMRQEVHRGSSPLSNHRFEEMEGKKKKNMQLQHL